MTKRTLTAVLAFVLAGLTACQAQPDTVAGWDGRWIGPEGTYLDITPTKTGFALELSDLDGPKTYPASVHGDTLQFERNGKQESVRHTNGVGTGMKWLSDKSNCVVVTFGSEGFCRS